MRPHINPERIGTLRAMADSYENLYPVLVAPDHERPRVIMQTARLALGYEQDADICTIAEPGRSETLFLMTALRNRVPQDRVWQS